MTTDSECQRRVRPLYDWEIAEARRVFGDSLRYGSVRIHECSTWTDALDRLGRKLKRLDPPGPRDHNAVTLGFHLHFPINLPTVHRFMTSLVKSRMSCKRICSIAPSPDDALQYPHRKLQLLVRQMPAFASAPGLILISPAS